LTIDIRKVAAQNFARDAREPVTETTPEEISPEVIAFSESLGAKAPLYVPVQQDPCGIYGMCFVGVADKIKADAGSICHGWAIWETLPGLFLTAEFHAVWVSPSGELIDITPKPQRETRVVFAPDPRYAADFDFLKRPNSHRVRIYRPADLVERARERIAQFNTRQYEYESGRAARKGVSLEEWVASKLPRDPVPDLIDEVLAKAAEKDRLLTPVSQGAFCSDIPRMHSLQNEIARRLQQIRSLQPAGRTDLRPGSVKLELDAAL
jgi:hypothetical protein